MTPAEVGQLLTVAAEFDARIVVTAERARVWHLALQDVDFAAAQRAVVAHYRGSADSLLPVHVMDGVREIRAERAARPPELPVAEQRVCRAAGIPPEEWAERRSDRGWVRAVSAAHGLAVPESGQDGPRMVGVGNDTKASVSGALSGAQRRGEATS